MPFVFFLGVVAVAGGVGAAAAAGASPSRTILLRTVLPLGVGFPENAIERAGVYEEPSGQRRNYIVCHGRRNLRILGMTDAVLLSDDLPVRA